MPKKSANPRSGAPRTRPRAQKSFELVRPAAETEEPQSETENHVESSPSGVAPVEVAPAGARKEAAAAKTVTPVTEATGEKRAQREGVNGGGSAPKGSAAARLAERRQATQRAQQRNAASLITAEHFTYVRRDLVTIAILAGILLVIIIILFVTLGTTL